MKTNYTIIKIERRRDHDMIIVDICGVQFNKRL